jgi:hypothetical protein
LAVVAAVGVERSVVGEDVIEEDVIEVDPDIRLSLLRPGVPGQAHATLAKRRSKAAGARPAAG